MTDAAARFKAMHAQKPGFVMPNAWDPGTAILLAAEGFKAIATTSGGIAFSLGKPDYSVPGARFTVSREEMFARIREIVAAVRLPVNGDLEAGYGESPEAVAETIRLAIDAGLAGGNIEDKDPCKAGLYDATLAAERIAAARQAIAAAKSDFVLTARTDALVGPDGSIDEAVRRANLYRKAGADCLFPPGASDPAVIATLVREIDGPLNIVMGLGTAAGNAHALIAMGVQRISTGASMARSALAFIRNAARELRDRGTVTYAEAQIQQGQLNDLFLEARS